jgi:hypothetical protein
MFPSEVGFVMRVNQNKLTSPIPDPSVLIEILNDSHIDERRF